MKHKPLSGKILLLPVLLLLLFIGTAPLLSGLYNSFFHDRYGERSFAGLEHYRRFFTDRGFLYSLRLTLLRAVLCTGLSLGLSFLFAVRLCQARGTGLFFYLSLLIPWGIPVFIAVPLWRVLLHGSGGDSLLSLLTGLRLNLLTDPAAAFLATVLVGVWLAVPITTFVFWGILKKVPTTMLEAARLDGAGEPQLALSVYLPQLKQGLLVMGVLNFIKALKEFTVIFLLTSGGPPLVSGVTGSRILGATTTLEIYLYEIFAESSDFGLPACYAVIMIGLVLFFLLFWIILHREPRKNSQLILFTALAQLLLAWPLGLIWAGGYLLALKWRKLFYPCFGLSLVVNLYQVARYGFLAAFNCGLPIALVCCLLLWAGRQHRSRIIRLPAGVNWLWYGISRFSFLLNAVISLALVYLVLWLSFSRVNACYIDTVLPRFMTTGNFIRIFAEEQVSRPFINTLVISGITALLIPFFSLPCAFVLSRAGGRFADFWLSFIKALGIMTGIHSLIPLYSLFNKLHLLDSYFPLILIYLFHAIGFSVFTMKTYLDSLPVGFHETALLEGMRPLAYLIKIVVPVAGPVIITAIMVAFLGAWNGFLVPLLFLNDDALYPISLKLYSFIGSLGSGQTRWNLFAATSLVNLFLIVLIFLFLKKKVAYSPLAECEYYD